MDVRSPLVNATNDNNINDTYLELKVKLKEWEHDFILKNKRSPQKNDIKNLPRVKQMYKNYFKCKKKIAIGGNLSNSKLYKNTPTKVNVHNTTDLPATKGTPIMQATMSENNNNSTVDMDIGPTPQINGKLVSILEMEMSPLKRIPTINITHDNYNSSDDAGTNDMTTLEKQSIASFSSSPLHQLQITNAKRKLNFDIDLNKNDDYDEFSSNNEVVDNLKLSPKRPSSILPINSPNKLLQNVSLQIKKDDANLGKTATPLPQPDVYPSTLKSDNMSPSVVSPSPLIKLSQHCSTKSLSELAKEHEQLVVEFQESNAKNIKRNLFKDIIGRGELDSKADIDSEHDLKNTEDKNENDEEEIEKSIKRNLKKRRRIIKVAAQNVPKKDSKIPKNLHRELRRLKVKKLVEYGGDSTAFMDEKEQEEEYISETGDEEEETLPSVKTKNVSRKKKYNLVSNNFRRLKIPNTKKRHRSFKRFGGKR
ncbi:Sld2p SCDLUD_004080 [Saccharomycodes ludwigii]|nr:hypothetical protein SCDLUD_004080 [Saccharomycodes ludwigii]KAH3899789.1 hypothetical protein SCDLUD_004080 [Saccharomycodes ludwigii]